VTRVYPVSLGCPKNRVDTEKLLAELKARGAETVLDPAEADVLLVNTCAFIREAVEESLDVILELAEEKTPAQRLVVMGCLVSRYREELLAELPEVDLFLGIEAYRAPEAVLSPPARYLLRLEGPETPRRILTESPFFAYLKVTEGCRHACSFCTIPRIRGPLRSLPAPLLLEEARALLEEGVKELILVGQDVSAYGLDHGEPALVSLINELLNLEGLRWLRLLYLHPEGVRDELLELMAREPRICPYLDLPVQHASAKVLKAMRRPYDPERILRLLERLRKEVPQIAVRTSVIVGFPGETEEDFGQLLDFLREAAFDHLGAFIYSPEEGTLAAKMPDQVPEEEKKSRFEEVMLLQQEISSARLAERRGQETEVLIEGFDEEGRPYGHARFQAPEVDGVTVVVEGEASPGDLVRVKITDSDVYDLYARAEAVIA